MTVTAYTADDLFDALIRTPDFLLLDVRNDVEFGRFKVEGPHPFEMRNVPYMEFVEHEAESVAKVPRRDAIRIVCAKEGSAKYVGEILENHGYKNIRYLAGGIKSWGNLLTPARVNPEGEDYALFQFRRPGKASCSYGLIYDRQMMVFDPAKNIEAYIDVAEAGNARITHTFETHRQADYISGSPALHKTVGARIMAPDPDFTVAKFPYTSVKDGDVFTFNGKGPQVRAIHTPGHTPGSTCYLINDRFLLSGDTAFILSIGRPDLGGMAEAWSRMLFKTMTEIIIPMDPSVGLLPGHYMDWKEANPDWIFTASLGEIKKRNASIYGIRDADRFYAFINENLRPQPPEYAKIREINAGLVEVDAEEQDIMDLGKNECAASAMQAGH